MKIRSTGFVLLLFAGHAAQGADEAALKQVVKGKVEEINNAVLKEDYGKVADLTHPKAVELLGGRKKMISLMEAGTKEMKAKGFEFRSFKIDAPSDPVKSGSELFVIVPFLLEMKAPGGRLLQKAFVIGVSGDMGKNWVFVNGGDANKLKQILPSLPEELKLPEKQKPVFEKE